MVRAKPYTVYFSILQFVNIAASITISAFLVVFLTQVGYTETEIGLLISVINFASMIGQPVLGVAVDKSRSYKKILMATVATGIAVQLLIPVAAEKKFFITLLFVVYGLSFRSVSPIIDSWTLAAAKKKPDINYGMARGIGSLGSSVAAVVVGRIVDLLGINSIFYVFAALAACSILVAFLLGEDAAAYQAKATEKQTVPWTEWLRQYRSYWALEACVFLTFVAYWPTTSTYFSVLMLECGGTAQNVGWAQAIMSLSEVPVLMISQKLIRKFGDKQLIVFGFWMLCLRIFVNIPMCVSPMLLTWAPVLQGVSFGILFPACLHYINRAMPDGTRTMAITINSVIMMSASAIIGNSAAGVLAGGFGVASIYRVGSVIAMAAAILVTAGYLKERPVS